MPDSLRRARERSTSRNLTANREAPSRCSRDARPVNIWQHRTLLINGGLVLVLIGAGVGSYLAIQPSSSGASVVTTTVQRGTVLATVSASGTVDPSRNLGLNFTTGGQLTAIYVKVGQNVHAGQKLAKVNAT